MLSKYMYAKHFNSYKVCGRVTNWCIPAGCFHSDTKISESYAPPKHARVVICGGGVMGAAVAYHLAKLGWGSDTLLIEQSR